MYGGVPGVLSWAQVESAIGRPYSGYYRPIWKKCGALIQSMAGNHGFADGNKRTTFILVNILIERSGYKLFGLNQEDAGDALEDVIVTAASSVTRVEELMDWFRQRLKPAQ